MLSRPSTSSTTRSRTAPPRRRAASPAGSPAATNRCRPIQKTGCDGTMIIGGAAPFVLYLANLPVLYRQGQRFSSLGELRVCQW